MSILIIITVYMSLPIFIICHDGVTWLLLFFVSFVIFEVRILIFLLLFLFICLYFSVQLY